MDEEKGIEQRIENSNSRFYEALESLSIEKMEEVWKHSDNTICIHPGPQYGKVGQGYLKTLG